MILRRFLCAISFIMGVGSVHLDIEGLPDNSCKITDEEGLEKSCDYIFDDPAKIDMTLPLKCILTKENQFTYDISFGNKTRKAPAEDRTTPISNDITLTANNETIECRASMSTRSGYPFSVYVHIYYIPPTPTEPTSEPMTPTESTTGIQVPSTDDLQNTASLSGANKDGSTWWLKFVLGGGAGLITLSIVVCCVVYYRRKKPPPDSSTYANLTKDLNNYQTLPLPAPRTLVKPGVALKRAVKPKVTIEGTYSEPKDSQDMSEALYADPGRFNGSETYAEPYAKIGPNNTYAEPYKVDFAEPKEGNYAEVGVNNSATAVANNLNNRELYARPIPKAQRPPKAQNESNYSNVFTEQYANMKKC